jgi:hypothetical protein
MREGRKMQKAGRRNLVIAGMMLLAVQGTALAQSSARNDYIHDCAECHGVDGKGAGPNKRMLRGYRSVDLTELSKINGGEFPRQRVYYAIDGRDRIAAHFQGSMPRWGTLYGNREDNSRTEVSRRISALVDYIESLQEK